MKMTGRRAFQTQCWFRRGPGGRGKVTRGAFEPGRPLERFDLQIVLSKNFS
jgi:hypothetical protein